MKTPNLIDILSQPTERKPEKNAPFIEDVAETPDNDILEAPQRTVENPFPNENDFAPEPPRPEPIPPKVEKPRLPFSENLKTAEMIIGSYNVFQILTFPYFYKKAIFDKSEFKQIIDLKTKMRQDTNITLSEKETILMDKFATFSELRDNVPFTEIETEAIKTPLAKVLGKYNVQLGPEVMLISALGMVALPRIMPFFSKLEKL